MKLLVRHYFQCTISDILFGEYPVYPLCLEHINRKAFKERVKPGWHYFGRKMVSCPYIIPSCIALCSKIEFTADVKGERFSCVYDASSFATGCCGLRMDDVVLYIPQSYPFCSHWPRYLCQDIHPVSPEGACMCVNALELAQQSDCIQV